MIIKAIFFYAEECNICLSFFLLQNTKKEGFVRLAFYIKFI